MVKFLDLAAQYSTLKQEIDTVIRDVIMKSAFVGGEYVTNFEIDFARYIGVQHCLGVANGTDAIEIAIEALDLPPGSEIIVPANSFIASSEAVSRQGHRVIFADVDPRSYTISIEDVQKRITPRTRAIICVHLYGHPCDMDMLQDLANANDIYIIEDCAQAHGAEYKGQRVGAIGDIATFSFYPGKNLGAYGDGGAITTNSAEFANKCRMIANHGRIEKYNHEFEGRNSRLDGLQAAVLSIKLKHLDNWIEKRVEVANYYLSKLSHIELISLPSKQNWVKHAYHLFVIRTDKRDSLAEFLANKGIQTGIHYPISLPKLKAYEYTGQGNEDMFANQSDKCLLSLPIGEHLSRENLEKVVAAIEEYFESV